MCCCALLIHSLHSLNTTDSANMSRLTENSLHIPSTSNAKATVHFSQLGSQLDSFCTNPRECESTLTNHSKAEFISTPHHTPPLQHGKSDAKCLFSNRPCQCVTSKLANVRPWDEHRRQQWLTSWPKNNKHNKDACATAQGGHFACLNSKSTGIYTKNLCHWEPPSWGQSSYININKNTIKRTFRQDVKLKQQNAHRPPSCTLPQSF